MQVPIQYAANRVSGRRAIGRSRREPRSVGGVRRDSRLRVRFAPQIDPTFAARLRALPRKLSDRFQRRAMRQAMNVFRSLLKSLYAKHRSKVNHQHLDDSIASVSRIYRRQHGERVLWAASGFRAGAIGSAPRLIGSTRRKSESVGLAEWSGWRSHFSERGFTATGGIRRGTKTLRELRKKIAAGGGRFVPGRHYIPKVFQAGRHAAASAFDHALANLFKSEGRRVGRLPKNILQRELADLMR